MPDPLIDVAINHIFNGVCPIVAIAEATAQNATTATTYSSALASAVANAGSVSVAGAPVMFVLIKVS